MTKDREQKKQFRRSIFISLVGHMALFGAFSFSFGEKFINSGNTRIYFYGAVLSKSDIMPKKFFTGQQIIPAVFAEKIKNNADKNKEDDKFISTDFVKPKLDFPSIALPQSFLKGERGNFPLPCPAPSIFDSIKNKPAIMFYPHLPFYFNLYFNDRQTAHIELMFNVNSAFKTNSVFLKRKISSGNLEVDLLVMRYLSHYLFIQQKKFSSGDWQTVKIDFSPK